MFKEILIKTLNEHRLKEKKFQGISLVVQWLRLHTSTSGAQVQSLDRELRSHMLHGMAKKIKILIKVIINKTKKEKKLQILLTQLILRDIYRILHPTTAHMEFFQHKPYVMS